MSPLGDNTSEMNTLREIDDATAEALLRGGQVDAGLWPLARAVHAYREVGRRPIEPSGELATRIATGVFTPVAPAMGDRTGRRGVLTAPMSNWRRIRMAILTGLAAATAKVAGMSVAAKATAGLSIAAASMGTAGFVGVLPDPVQDRFDTVVEQVTPNQAPATPDDNAEFGERVSEDAKDGGVDGGEISEEARQQGELRRPGGLPAPGDSGAPEDLELPATTPTSPGDGDTPGEPDHPGPDPTQRPEPPTQP
jgi:hypothetical protein